ncbi:MAG: hypothetical protein KY476_26250, partial [Planctomycetes bacterium]|nr:hypothetical protein [Planctomycetota bacterium]
LRGLEAQQWPALHPPGPARYRTLIPSSFVVTFDDLRHQLAVADEVLQRKQQQLAQMNDLDQRSQEQLDTRRQELAAALADVETTQEARDDALLGLDRLRRELQDAHANLQRLVAATKKLEQSLPHPEPALTSAVGGQ